MITQLKSGFGYAWAGLCFVVILATFLGMNFWERTLAEGTGIHVAPVFSGGEVRRTIEHNGFRTLVHRPVFDGLIGERTEGFIQIDWVPNVGYSLPETIEEDLDFDGNGSAEVHVRLDAGKVQMSPRVAWVLGAEPMVPADSERILRIRLRNPAK